MSTPRSRPSTIPRRHCGCRSPSRCRRRTILHLEPSSRRRPRRTRRDRRARTAPRSPANHSWKRGDCAVSMVTSSMLGRSPSQTKTRSARPPTRSAGRIRSSAACHRVSQCKALNEVTRSNSDSYARVAAVPTSNRPGRHGGTAAEPPPPWPPTDRRRRASQWSAESATIAVTRPSPQPTSSTRSSPRTTRSPSARLATSCCRLLTNPYDSGSQSATRSSCRLPAGRG